MLSLAKAVLTSTNSEKFKNIDFLISEAQKYELNYLIR